MRKNGKGKLAGLTVLVMALCVTAAAGCGSPAGSAAVKTEDAAGYDSWDGGIYNSAAAVEEIKEADYEAGTSAETVTDQSRKLIKNVDMSVETEAFDALIENVKQRVEALGGYVEQSNIYNGSYTSDYRSRSASITARIPAEQLDQFVTDVAEQSNVIRKNESIEDVTLQYVDLESHKRALLAEQESLLSMLENAESIEDIIAINEQLTDVRYRLESMESQLRTYDNKINYSTVYLSVEEVEQYEPYAAKSTSERIREGFVRNLRRVGNGIANFFIELIIALPVIAAAAVIIGVLGLLLYLLIKCSEKRAAKRRERLAAENPGMYNRYGMRRPAGGRTGRAQRADAPDRAFKEGTASKKAADAPDEGLSGYRPCDVSPNEKKPPER